MTQYEKMMSMSVDELSLVCVLLYERFVARVIKEMAKQGAIIEYAHLSRELEKAIYKNWLMGEVAE